MFQFPRFPSPGLYIQPGDAAGSPQRVSPFGHPRINACTRLPEAYRSVPRPSSAFGAKASTVSLQYLPQHVMRRNRNSFEFLFYFCVITIHLVRCEYFVRRLAAERCFSHHPGQEHLSPANLIFRQDDPAHRRVGIQPQDVPVNRYGVIV
jgi:hypothetical protein